MKKRLAVFVLFIVFLLPLFVRAQRPAAVDSGSVAVTAGAAARIEGIIVRVGSREPVANATVELRSTVGGRGYPNRGVGPSALGPVIDNTTTKTDRDGKFLLPAPVGTFRLYAAKDGYVRTSGLTVTTLPGQTLTAGSMEMTLGGMISGRVTDRGQPAANASVVARRISYSDTGDRVLTDAQSWVTDELGRYRIFGLAPGRYYVAASLGSAPSQVTVNVDTDSLTDVRFAPNAPAAVAVTRSEVRRTVLRDPFTSRPDETYVPTYYPNTPDAQRAIAIDVQSGGDVSGINIDSSPQLVRRVRGRVTGAAAQSPLSVRLIHAGSGMETTASPGRDGSFDIAVAMEGRYALLASVAQPGAPAQRGAGARGRASSPLFEARAEIEVLKADVNDVRLDLAPTLSLAGLIEIESQLSPTSSGVGGLSVTLRPEPPVRGLRGYTAAAATSQGPSGTAISITDTGNGDLRLSRSASFERLSVPPGNYRVLVGPMHTGPPVSIPANLENTFKALENAYVQSITLGDINVLKDGLQLKEQPKEPLRIVIGTKPGLLSGHAVDDRHQPMAGATVVLIPQGDLRFRVRHQFVTTGSDGAFQITGVAPGAYQLFAWESVETYAWQNPDFIAPYEGRSQKLEIKEGQPQSVDISVIR